MVVLMLMATLTYRDGCHKSAHSLPEETIFGTDLLPNQVTLSDDQIETFSIAPVNYNYKKVCNIASQNVTFLVIASKLKELSDLVPTR